MTIETWVNNRIKPYLAAGMKAAGAADFVLGELYAVYTGNHWTHGIDGNTPPEPMSANDAMAKADAVLKTLIEGFTAAPLNTDTQTHHEGQTDATTPRLEAIQAVSRQGIDALKHYIDNGIKLIGTYESGAAIASGTDYLPAFTSCIDDIEALQQGKGDRQGRAKGTSINRFRFIPKDYGYLVIDIDRNHTDGLDGLELFYKFFESVGKIRPAMPSTMRNIEGGSFPCYTSTPSGGFHLYFKFNGDLKLKQTLDGKGVDILYTKQATAAGSAKTNGAYILHGNLADAPELYGFIKQRITQPEPTAAPQVKQEYNKKFTGKAAWDKIVNWTDADGYGTGGRNERAFSLAYKAATHNWTLSETISALRAEPSINGLPAHEIETSAKSAYKKAGKAA